MKHGCTAATPATSPVSSEPACAWIQDFEEENSPRCTTGKPALHYSCNEFGPVCEDHRCRCRPSLLTERAEKARLAAIERCDAALGKDVEVRSFRIRGTRVHGHAPGSHGDDSGEWLVYYNAQPEAWPVKIARAANLHDALKLARQLAALYDGEQNQKRSQ